MPIRAALILAIMVQQFALPAVMAHGSGGCEAAAAVPSGSASCCSMPQRADRQEREGACTCLPALCACDRQDVPTPAAPERTNRSVDHLVASLATPTATLPALPRALSAARPRGRVRATTEDNRRQAVLCIWQT